MAKRKHRAAAGFAGLMLAAGLTVVGMGTASAAADHVRIDIEDDCDPATFNLPQPQGLGPGACLEDGDTTLASAFAQVAATGRIVGWDMDPPKLSIRARQPLKVENDGGEEHTFSRVTAFGGGIVPPLNNPAKLPDTAKIADGCLALVTTGPTATNFFLPSDEERRIPTGPGTSLTASTRPYLFQCCIHPCMRTAITINNRDGDNRGRDH